MGVSVLYFCPIFEAASNHRYDTADYGKIDPMLGTEEEFRALCQSARERGIRVVLDGVFNHTGSRSLYFNQDGWYPTLGASQSQESPYYGWFSFHPWPNSYDSWWGIDTLPAVREDHPGYTNYIIEHEDSIVRRWLRAGASGWRLDVADELPDAFIEKLRTAVEETSPDALLLGEVWEDASSKIAYSRRRKYLLGRELHGVMNYPFRSALLTYLLGGGAEDFRESMEALRENYPRDAFYSAMNFLGTHDTPRILTLLGASCTPESKDDRAAYRLSPEERSKGLALVRLAVLVLLSFPGAPMIYYGDEVAMEGFEDPLNRGGYNWDHGDQALRDWFSRLGCLRRDLPPFTGGISAGSTPPGLCWLSPGNLRGNRCSPWSMPRQSTSAWISPGVPLSGIFSPGSPLSRRRDGFYWSYPPTAAFFWGRNPKSPLPGDVSRETSPGSFLAERPTSPTGGFPSYALAKSSR